MQNNPKLLLIYSLITDGNMSFVRGNYEETLLNRQNFLQKNNLSLTQTVWMKTPHEGDVHIASIHDTAKGSKDPESTFPVDALITNQKGLILSLLTADCIPLSLFDPKTNTIALVHVSRLNVNEIIENTIYTMTKNFNTDPKNLKAEIGPSIGPCCYTWDPGKNPATDKLYAGFITTNDNDQPTLDLWSLTEQNLTTQGLKTTNINNPKICSYHSGQYFSHRKFAEHNLENDYRIATFFVLK